MRQALDLTTDEVAERAAVDGDAARLLARAMLRRAALARESLEEFYRFVIRHETTKRALEPSPHQCLLFSFVQAHQREAVVRIPVGTGKTFLVGAYALWQLGRDPTSRSAIVSRVRRQAQKPLAMVSDYITEPELNGRLRLVFPELVPSARPGDPWSNVQITVKRPPGIRDSSLLAAGIGQIIHGARLSRLFGDDSIDIENSKTPEIREETTSKYESHQLQRLDPGTGGALFTNTPWHREDTTYYLENVRGWPAITMDVYGNITINNADAAWMAMALEKLIRPSVMRPGKYRMRAYDPDPNEESVLWPERYSAAMIREIRYGKSGTGGMLPHTFAQTMLCEPMDENASRCQRAWIELCKLDGMGTTLVRQYEGPHRTYCGIDLGIGTKDRHDCTAFVVFALEDKGRRRLLQVESGRWSGQEVVAKIIDYAKRYGCSFHVEDNFGQDFLRQWALSERRDLMIRSHTTGAHNKRDMDFGVESIFTELQQRAWIIPCSPTGVMEPATQKLMDGALFYNPNDHVADELMAMWIAREGARGAGTAHVNRSTHGRTRDAVQYRGGF